MATTNERMTNAPDHWYECPDCRCIHPSKKRAEDCCKGRFSKETADRKLVGRVNDDGTWGGSG